MKVNYKEDIATMSDEQLYKEAVLHKVTTVKLLTLGAMLIVPAQPASSFSEDFAIPHIEVNANYRGTPFIPTEVLTGHRLNQALSARMYAIASLKNNWDGYGAVAIPETIVKNARRFLVTLQEKGVEIDDPTDVYPTSYGTIVIEYNNDRGLVSMEIDSHRIGFFTDYKTSGNWGTEGIDTNFQDIPQELVSHLL